MLYISYEIMCPDLKDEAYTINCVRASEQDFISISCVFEFRYVEARTLVI